MPDTKPGTPLKVEPDITEDAGHRPWFGPNGEVHGSGAGAGGGNPGEDYDQDPQGGDGTVDFESE